VTLPPQPGMPSDPYGPPSEHTPAPGVNVPWAAATQRLPVQPPPPYAPGPYPPPQYAPVPYPPQLPPPRPAGNTGLIVGVVLVVVMVALLGVGAVVVFAGHIFSPRSHSSTAQSRTDSGSNDSSDSGNATAPWNTSSQAQPAEPTRPPPPVKVGDCIGVDTQGTYEGLGDCSKPRGTYRVLTVDAGQRTCADSLSPYIFVNGYKLCLELYLVRGYCYRFPTGRGWVVGATCKAKGTVHIIDIVQNANNGNSCTRAYKWNHWYQFLHPKVVYCVMQY
jgi:hypothetical protein